jgi:hypothetical protein
MMLMSANGDDLSSREMGERLGERLQVGDASVVRFLENAMILARDIRCKMSVNGNRDTTIRIHEPRRVNEPMPTIRSCGLLPGLQPPLAECSDAPADAMPLGVVDPHTAESGVVWENKEGVLPSPKKLLLSPPLSTLHRQIKYN